MALSAIVLPLGIILQSMQCHGTSYSGNDLLSRSLTDNSDARIFPEVDSGIDMELGLPLDDGDEFICRAITDGIKGIPSIESRESLQSCAVSPEFSESFRETPNLLGSDVAPPQFEDDSFEDDTDSSSFPESEAMMVFQSLLDMFRGAYSRDLNKIKKYLKRNIDSGSCSVEDLCDFDLSQKRGWKGRFYCGQDGALTTIDLSYRGGDKMSGTLDLSTIEYTVGFIDLLNQNISNIEGLDVYQRNNGLELKKLNIRGTPQELITSIDPSKYPLIQIIWESKYPRYRRTKQ